MNEREAFDAVLVRAVETADTEAHVLDRSAREAASRHAAQIAGAGEAVSDRFIAERSRQLAERLAADSPIVARARRMGHGLWRLVAVVFVVSFVIGVLGDALGGGRRINVLATPLAFLILWNLAIYLLLAARTLGAPAPGMSLWRSAGASLARLRVPRAAAQLHTVLAQALGDAARSWAQVAAPLHRSRGALLLHAAAGALALGAIASMYLRGTAFEFLAGWESTFLEAGGIRTALQWILGPGALLLGQSLPDAAHLATIRFRDGMGGEPAGPWIHLYAASALAVIVLPRLVLASVAGWRARRLAVALPMSLGDPYFRELAVQGRGAPAHVIVAPYSYSPAEEATDRVRAFLARAFGDRTRVEFTAPLGYGEERRADDGPTDENEIRALLFSLAATPEAEVHGNAVSREGVQRVLVDEGPYAARLGKGVEAGRQLDSRRALWRDMLRPCGIEPDFIPSGT